MAETFENPTAASACAPSGGGILHLFPPALQKKIVDELLKQECERATDIWYHDETTKTVWVMRHNIHWQLNETASVIWTRLGEASVADLLGKMHEHFAGADAEEVRCHFAEFLLQAYNNGLVTMP